MRHLKPQAELGEFLSLRRNRPKDRSAANPMVESASEAENPLLARPLPKPFVANFAPRFSVATGTHSESAEVSPVELASVVDLHPGDVPGAG